MGFKNTKDKIKAIEKLGHIPANIGYDPFLAFELSCSLCGVKRNYMADQFKGGDKGRLKRRERFICCKVCGDRMRVERKMDRARAFHLNDIRFRSTSIDLGAFDHEI